MEDIDSWKEKFEICCYSKKLLDEITYLNTIVKNPVDIEEVKKAIYYARKYHGAQMRQSGEPYYSHPVFVASMFAEFVAKKIPRFYTTTLLQAALLHDSIEDTELNEEMIISIFNQEVARCVVDLTRTTDHGKISAEENLSFLIKEKKYGSTLLKLFDRIHNVQTLGSKPPEKARKIIKESLIHFSLVAACLEIQDIEKKLFKICGAYFSVESDDFDKTE